MEGCGIYQPSRGSAPGQQWRRVANCGDVAAGIRQSRCRPCSRWASRLRGTEWQFAGLMGTESASRWYSGRFAAAPTIRESRRVADCGDLAAGICQSAVSRLRGGAAGRRRSARRWAGAFDRAALVEDDVGVVQGDSALRSDLLEVEVGRSGRIAYDH